MESSHAAIGRPRWNGISLIGLALWIAGFCLACGAVVFGGGSFEGTESKLALTGAVVAVESVLLARGFVACFEGPRLLGVVLVAASLLSGALWISEIWRHTDSGVAATQAIAASVVAGAAAVMILSMGHGMQARSGRWLTALVWLSVAVIALLCLAALATVGNN